MDISFYRRERFRAIVGVLFLCHHPLFNTASKICCLGATFSNFSAKGALHFQPGASPQEFCSREKESAESASQQPLLLPFVGSALSALVGFLGRMSGALPQAMMITTPLALHRYRHSGFASLAASPYDACVLELEVYAAGVRDLNKILELDIELGPIAGLHYKVDRNHDIVYMELETPTVTFREIRSMFRKLGLEPKFVGAIPPELRPKTKTQLLDA
jgi:hypothetical protein